MKHVPLTESKVRVSADGHAAGLQRILFTTYCCVALLQGEPVPALICFAVQVKQATKVTIQEDLTSGTGAGQLLPMRASWYVDQSSTAPSYQLHAAHEAT